MKQTRKIFIDHPRIFYRTVNESGFQCFSWIQVLEKWNLKLNVELIEAENHSFLKHFKKKI